MGAASRMSFEELVELLAQYAQDREPSALELAVQRSVVERELMQRLGTAPASSERRASVRVPGHRAIRLHVGADLVRATLRDLGEGGVRVLSSLAPPIGATIDVELGVPDGDQPHPARAEAAVMWLRQVEQHGFELGLRFTDDTDAHRRRMRRIILEMLRAIPL